MKRFIKQKTIIQIVSRYHKITSKHTDLVKYQKKYSCFPKSLHNYPATMCHFNAIIIVVGLLTLLSFPSCDRSYDIVMITSNAGGISETSELEVEGVKIGNVKSIDLTEDLQVAVTLSIDSDIQIPTDSKFSVQTVSILGESGIRIIAGDNNETLGSGDTVLLSAAQPLIQDSSIINSLSGLLREFIYPSTKDSILNELKMINERLDLLEHRK